jgi:hypothetical protein
VIFWAGAILGRPALAEKIRVHSIVKAYEKVRAIAAYVLVGLAFVASRLEIGEVRDGAMVAASLIGLQILFSINKALAKETPEQKSFDGFHDAIIDFRTRVDDLLKAGEKVHVKWIGLSMEYGAPHIAAVNKALAAERRKRLRWTVVMQNPDSMENLEPFDSWRHVTESSISMLKRILSPSQGDELHLYQHLPNWHGLSINDKFLYISTCQWRSVDGVSALVVGDNKYQLLTVGSDEGAHLHLDNFNGWHSFSRQKDALSPPGIGPGANAI